MNFKCMGDPHLGRSFKTGVPLHRVGERERLIREQFERELMEVKTDLHVGLGDTFDKFVVAPEVVLFAADVYTRAVKANPGTRFIVLRGNHDVSRDLNKASSFELFKRLCPEVTVVDEAPLVIGNFGFVPFDAFKTAADQIRELPDGLDRVFTHFDYTDFGGDHVLPTALLAEKGILQVTNGHDHLRRTEKRHGVTVDIFGSLQPYTHAEDGEGRWYRTVSLDELAGLDATNLNIRVLLQEGEVMPAELDCLSLIAKRVSSEAVVVDTHEFDGIDIGAALSALLPESIRAEVMEVFHQ